MLTGPEPNHFSDTPDWARWMAAAQSGDVASYRKLLRAAIPMIRAIVRKRVCDIEIIDDIVQETLLTLHRVRNTYDPDRPFPPWLSAIANARLVDVLRKQGRTRSREIVDAEALMEHADETDANGVDAVASKIDVRRLLDGLPADKRQIVEWVKLRGMSLEEVSARTAVSIPALKALLRRAIRRLRGSERSNGERP